MVATGTRVPRKVSSPWQTRGSATRCLPTRVGARLLLLVFRLVVVFAGIGIRFPMKFFRVVPRLERASYGADFCIVPRKVGSADASPPNGEYRYHPSATASMPHSTGTLSLAFTDGVSVTARSFST